MEHRVPRMGKKIIVILYKFIISIYYWEGEYNNVAMYIADGRHMRGGGGATSKH